MGAEVGDAIGRIIGAPAGSVSMHENVTTAHAVVLSCLPVPGRRRRLVCCAGDFPSTIYLLRAQEALGLRADDRSAEADFSVDVRRVVDAIDDATALVAISHVLFRSSFILDPQPIIERAHAVGRASGPRHVSIRGHHPRRRHCARGGLRHGRVPEVAVWRSGQRVSLHPSRPAAHGAPAAHRLVLARRAVRVRPRGASSRMPMHVG